VGGEGTVHRTGSRSQTNSHSCALKKNGEKANGEKRKGKGQNQHKRGTEKESRARVQSSDSKRENREIKPVGEGNENGAPQFCH